jgi:hypothetical protein
LDSPNLQRVNLHAKDIQASLEKSLLLVGKGVQDVGNSSQRKGVNHTLSQIYTAI